MINYISKLFNKYIIFLNFKKIINNIGWLSLDVVIKIIVGLFVSVFVIRYLGPEQYGLFSYALSLVSLVGIFSTLGLESIVVKELVKKPLKENLILGTTFYLTFIASIVSLIIVITIILLKKSTDNQLLEITSIVGSGMLFKAFNSIDYYFQSKVLSKYVVWAKNIGFLISTILKILFVLIKVPLIGFAYINLLELVVTSTLLIKFYFKNGKSIFVWKINIKTVKYLLKDSWPLLISSIMVMIYMKIDQIMLGNILGNKSVGIYSAAVKLSEVVYFIPLIISSSVYPMLIISRKLDKSVYRKKIQYLYLLMSILGILIAISTYFIAPFIIDLLYGSEYLESVKVLRIHIWAAVFVFIGVANNKTFMIIENYTKYFLVTSIVGAIINILLNLYLIPKYNVQGAAFATFLAQIGAFVAQIIFLKVRDNFILQIRALFLIDVWQLFYRKIF